MTAADQIAELQRQRAEKHRLIDDEYDKRVRMVRELCKHTWDFWQVPHTGRITKICYECGELECNIYDRIMSGAPMP